MPVLLHNCLWCKEKEKKLNPSCKFSWEAHIYLLKCKAQLQNVKHSGCIKTTSRELPLVRPRDGAMGVVQNLKGNRYLNLLQAREGEPIQRENAVPGMRELTIIIVAIATATDPTASWK